MKKSAIILLLAICFVPLLDGQKMRYGQEPPKAKPGVDYAIRVHVSGIRIRTQCYGEACDKVLYADTALNGMKIELMGDSAFFPGYQVPLFPGDYQARLLKDPHKMGASPLYQEYEIVLPDKTVWHCTVTGIFE